MWAASSSSSSLRRAQIVGEFVQRVRVPLGQRVLFGSHARLLPQRAPPFNERSSTGGRLHAHHPFEEVLLGVEAAVRGALPRQPALGLLEPLQHPHLAVVGERGHQLRRQALPAAALEGGELGLEAVARLLVAALVIEGAVEVLADVEQLVEHGGHPLPGGRLAEEERPQGDGVEHLPPVDLHPRLLAAHGVGALLPGEGERLDGAAGRAAGLAGHHEDPAGVEVSELRVHLGHVRDQRAHGLSEVWAPAHFHHGPGTLPAPRANRHQNPQSLHASTRPSSATCATLTVDGTPPTLTSISDDKSGGPIPVNTLVTYTVTFSEDMDAVTVTPASFGNSGTATVTLGSVNEISPGVFTVEATPTAEGTLQLQIHAASALKDVAGNNLDTVSAILDDTTLTVDGTPPTLTSITDDKSGGPIPVNTLVTYTVTFSEDMDAGTVTPASFGNAGTATITLGSVNEISPGVFTVEATPTAEGTLQLQIHASSVLKDAAGNNLDTASAILDDTTLTVDGTPPTLTSITDDKSSGPIPVNTLVTYTVTFSEDMDAVTVTPASFGNAGTATITLGAINEITPGVFTVEATPTAEGTLQLQIHAATVLKDVAGNNLDTVTAILDDTTLAVQSPYNNWSASAAFDADANNDGVDNGTAWVLGAADPSSSATGLLPTLDNTDPEYIIFTYRRSDAANTDANTAIQVQYSSTLGIWVNAVHDGDNIIIQPSDNFYGSSPGVDKVEVRIKRNLVIGGKFFARLNVVTAP